MSTKRKDKKGRNLRNGECQRKDGRYQYEYTDINGDIKCVYSWKLEPTDPLPNGKRQCVSLREKEKEIQNALYSNVSPTGCNLTVLELIEKYVSLKRNIKESSLTFYLRLINRLKKYEFSKVKIDKIRPSDAKKWLIELQDTYDLKFATISTFVGIIKPAFNMAIEDDLLRKNPFKFSLSSVIVDDRKPKVALTVEQERNLLEFVKTHRIFYKYYDAIFILFSTGLRISEFCGLTVDDVDFDKKTIKVERQIYVTRDNKYMVVPPKTKSGYRVLPISDETCECFKRAINKRNWKFDPVVFDKNGSLVHNIIFLSTHRTTMSFSLWDNQFRSITKEYNLTHKDKLPSVTPHTCRHTYCSRAAAAGMNPKVLQYLMGHSTIDITFDVYTHVNFDNVKKEFEKLQNSAI